MSKSISVFLVPVSVQPEEKKLRTFEKLQALELNYI